MDYQFDFSFLSTHWQALLQGLISTLRMSVSTIVL